MKPDLGATIGKNIARLLDQHKMQQKDLALILSVDESSVGKWILGRNMPRMGRIQEIADYFGINKSEILGDSATQKDISTRIPILGTIAAGEPIFAEQNIEAYLSAPIEWSVDYALRVRGESMVNAGIPDGALVLCRRQADVDDGEIAVCIVDGENATLKRVKRYADILVLHPENPAFEDQVFKGKEKSIVKIVGLAKKVIREI